MVVTCSTVMRGIAFASSRSCQEVTRHARPRCVRWCLEATLFTTFFGTGVTPSKQSGRGCPTPRYRCTRQTRSALARNELRWRRGAWAGAAEALFDVFGLIPLRMLGEALFDSALAALRPDVHAQVAVSRCADSRGDPARRGGWLVKALGYGVSSDGAPRTLIRIGAHFHPRISLLTRLVSSLLSPCRTESRLTRRSPDELWELELLILLIQAMNSCRQPIHRCLMPIMGTRARRGQVAIPTLRTLSEARSGYDQGRP